MQPLPAVVIFAPTACGKTALAESLFASDADSPLAGTAEVVSADSIQVYRGFDIGSAKPGSDLLSRLPHHLIDILPPEAEFGAGEFVRYADAACADIAGRGKIPLIMGGTAFFIRNFLCGLPSTPRADPPIRSLIQKRAEIEGIEALYKELIRADPTAAHRIHKNDAYRIKRALEVIASGRLLSDYERPNTLRKEFAFCTIILTRDRSSLYKRIETRVDQMFTKGLAAEIKQLQDAGVDPRSPAMQAIGYREFYQYGQDSYASKEEWLDAVRQRIVSNSRHYAKKQETFFRGIPEARYFDAEDKRGIISCIEAFYERIGFFTDHPVPKGF